MHYFENIHTARRPQTRVLMHGAKTASDVGGNDEEMKALNAEYQTMLRRVMHRDFSTEAEGQANSLP